jgi:hypothetical protein
MIALETIAALVTIIGGVIAVLVWSFGRVSLLKSHNAELQAQLAALQTAPRQPEGCDYLVDAEGQPLCIHCFSTGQHRWKLIPENGQQRCPVCGKVTTRGQRTK